MITLKKLASLKESTRLRKHPRILYDLLHNQDWDEAYWQGLKQQLLAEAFWSKYHATLQDDEAEIVPRASNLRYRRLDTLYHNLLDELGMSVAEWDLNPYLQEDNTNVGDEGLLPIRFYLDDLRSPFNIGSLIRTSVAFGCDKIYLSENCCSLDHPRLIRSSMGTVNKLAVERTNIEELYKKEPNLFVLELGGKDIHSFDFPQEGCCALGSEELGVHPELYQWAKKNDRVLSIPLFGSNKVSLNVANAAAIVLDLWHHKIKN